MKNRILYIAGLLYILTAQSCENKPFPEDDIPQAEFQVSGEIDGEAIDLSAGSNGYFLFTDADHLVDEQWLLSGKMAPSQCPECGPSLEFRMYGTQNGPSNPIDIDELLQTGEQDFYVEDDHLRVLDLGSLYDQIELPFVSVNDEEVNEENVILDEDDEWVEIQYIAFDNIPFCQTEIGFDLNLLDCNETDQVISTFSIEYEDGFAYVQAPPFLAEMNIPVAWYVGWDALVPELISVGDEILTIAFEFGEPTTIIAAPASEEFDDWSYFCAQTIFDQLDGECPQVDFGVHSFPQQAHQVVELRYTDEDGEVYTTSGSCSIGFEQPESSHLSVAQIEEYVTDHNGNPTKRFVLEGDFDLQNVHNQGDLIHVSNLDAKFALAYPGD